MSRSISSPLVALAILFSFLPGDASADPPDADCTTQGQISLSECEALVALYNNLGGLEWELDWSGNDPCSWEGVTCSDPPAPRLVTEFRTSFDDLSGQIPPEIGDLVHLKVLILSGERSVTGSIPPEIGQLTQLEWLYFSLVPFSGSIPAEIGNLVNLQDLRLSGEFTGGFPPEFGNLASLTHLRVEPSRSSAPGMQGPIPDEFGNLSNLVELYLDNNSFGSPLPSTIGGLTSLEVFDAEEAGLIGELPASFGDLDALQRSDLSFNSFTGTLPPELANMDSLHSLRLEGNGFEGTIPVEWQTFRVGSLNLKRNRLSGTLAPEIGLMPNLSTLNVENNDLEGPLIPFFAASTTVPITFWFAGNQFSGEVPPGWTAPGAFQRISARWNCLTVTDPDAIALLDALDPGWDASQCLRVFEDGFDTGHTLRWDRIGNDP